MVNTNATKVSLDYNTISRFGFYSTRKGVTQISNQSEILDSMQSWFQDVKKLVNTCPFTRNADDGLYGVFLNDMIKTKDGDFIVVLWNEIPNLGGSVMGMSKDASPGTVTVEEADFDNGQFIPGYPSYFWFLPEHEALVQVAMKGIAPGKNNLKKFIEKFLANVSKYRVLEPITENVVGFSANGQPETNANLRRQSFVTNRIRKNNVLNEILASQHDITRVIKKEILTFDVNRSVNWLEKSFAGWLNADNLNTVNKRNVTQSLEYQPSRSEIKQMYDDFIELDDGSPVINIGFRVSGGKTIYFANEYEEVDTTLNLIKTKKQIVSAAELEKELCSRRADLIKPLLSK